MKKIAAHLCILALFFLPLLIDASTAPGASDPVAGRPATSEKSPSDETAFRLLDIGERSYQGGSAIAVILSEPLDPKVRHDRHLRISDGQDVLKSAWVLSDDNRTLYFPHVAPETEYTVTVMPSLTSAEGNTLQERTSQVVETRKISPILSFASDGLLLPAKMTDGLPVVTINIEEADIEFFQLNPKALAEFVNWERTAGKEGYYRLDQLKSRGELVYAGRFDLDAPDNRRVVRYIPVENIPELEPPGVYLAVMREPGEYNYSYPSAYFLVTDLALHARIYKNESLIFASSLSTGEPVEGAKLTFYNLKGALLQTGTTDALGRYRYTGKLSSSVRVITAAHGQNLSVLPMNLPALDMSAFDHGGRPQKSREFFAYSPRDLYRPGEPVIVSGLLRDHDGQMIDPLPLTAKLYRPDNREMKSFVWHPENLDRVGYYQTQIDLPGDAQTGTWNLKIFDDPASGTPLTVFEIQVEDFLPERMKLDLSAESGPLLPAEDLTVDVSGQYLYGAPAAGNRLTAKVLLKAHRDLFKEGRLKGFLFGKVADKEYRDYFELEETSLDSGGEATISVQSPWKEIESPLSAYVIASLYESGGRPVTRNIRREIWPAEEIIGIRPLFDDDNADEGPVSFEMVKIDENGNLLEAQNLMVALTKEDRDYYWEYSESTGWEQRYSEKNYQYLTDAITLEPGSPSQYTTQLNRGQYVLSIHDPVTGVSTSYRFQVGRWWYGGDEKAAARPDEVVLRLDKEAYRTGDIIRLTVIPPHESEGIILVEGEWPLWLKRMPLSASGTVVEIPVSARWDSHDLYISAVALRPADAAEKITPNRAVGLIHLPLDRDQRKLRMKITAPEKNAPHNPMTVQVSLQNESGQSPIPDEPLYVTLAAVDVGILNITDFKTPDPFGWFFAQRRYGVEAHDIYNKVIEYMEGQVAKLRFGGDADLAAGKPPETKVKLVSLFQGPVQFDKNGEAEITLDLPDFNGQLRIMGVAFGPTHFGSAETHVTVAAPVVTQLSTPRFLAPDDETLFTLDLHNMSGGAKEISLTLTAAEPLTLSDGERTLHLADGEKTTLRFPVKAGGDFEPSTIHLRADAGGINIDREWQIGVRPGYPGMARKIRQVLEKGEEMTLDDRLVSDLIPATAEIDLKIATVPPFDLRHAFKGLITYPYGCLEQTTSRAYPLLLATPEVIAKFDLPAISPKERAERLNSAVTRISTMQLPSGGFGLWNRTGPESPWLTPYVVDFLLSARDAGVSIPEEMLDSALTRLETYVNQGARVQEYVANDEQKHIEFAARAYAGYVLSKLNRAPLGALRTLYDHHQKSAASPLPLAHLGIALYNMGDRKRAGEALSTAAGKRREENAYWGDYGSPLRDMTLTLALLMEKEKPAPGFDKLLLDMENAMRDRRWLSTQEKYAILVAGLAFEGRADQQWSGILMTGGTEQKIAHKGTKLLSPDLSQVEKGFTFISNHEGMLYVSAVISGYTKNPPEPDTSQIALTRTLYDLEGNEITRNEFGVGELLMVHLRVDANQWIPDGLVVDFLPAGFEPENQNLKHAVKLEDFKIGEDSLWHLREETDILHEEYRDDRYAAAARLNEHGPTHLFYMVRVVSPGTFKVPPPFAESMYRPEIRGIGKTPAPITIINKKHLAEDMKPSE